MSTSDSAGAAASAGAGGSMVGSEGAEAAADPECDLSGFWIAQQLTVSEALGLPQTSNNWYFLELSQRGEDVTVAHSLDCGIEISGSATVTVSRETLTAAIRANPQDGRRGTMKRAGSVCALEVERFWSVRGAEARFVPSSGRAASESIPDVAKVQPLPSPEQTDGALDLEGDGQLGIAFKATGILEGTRNSVQRDWTRWFTEPGYEIMPSSDWIDDLVIRADFDNEEVVMHVTSSLLRTLSTPMAAKHVIRLRFLGRSRDDVRAQALITADDAETCYAVQDALPAAALEVM